MTQMSAAQFIPESDAPAHVRKALERQALWITRQNDLNQAHWAEIKRTESDCKDCKHDRQLAESLLDARLDAIQATQNQILGGIRWAVWSTPILLSVTATLFALAKATGVLK